MTEQQIDGLLGIVVLLVLLVAVWTCPVFKPYKSE